MTETALKESLSNARLYFGVSAAGFASLVSWLANTAVPSRWTIPALIGTAILFIAAALAARHLRRAVQELGEIPQ